MNRLALWREWPGYRIIPLFPVFQTEGGIFLRFFRFPYKFVPTMVPGLPGLLPWC